MTIQLQHRQRYQLLRSLKYNNNTNYYYYYYYY